MFLAFQQTVVQRLHQRVFVGLLDLGVDVRIVETLGSRFAANSVSAYRLSAAHDAALAACHDFDEVVVAFAGFYLLDQLLGVGQSADNGSLVFLVLIGNGDLLDAFASADSAVSAASTISS